MPEYDEKSIFVLACAAHFKQCFLHLVNRRDPLADYCSSHASVFPSVFDASFHPFCFHKEAVDEDSDFVIKTIINFNVMDFEPAKLLWKAYFLPDRDKNVKKSYFRSSYYRLRKKAIQQLYTIIHEDKAMTALIDQEVHSQKKIA